MINIGVIGYGYWGPNIVRNLFLTKGVKVKTIADQNPRALDQAKELYPYCTFTPDAETIFNDPLIDAVCIVTPVSTHFALAKRALEQGKHIFIEKPFTRTIQEARQLVSLAKRKKLIIMVDHTFIFTGAVRKIKELIDNGTLGNLYYFDSTRVNLGLFQHDVNVISDLAPHDFAIIDYLIPNKPVSITAHGMDHIGGQENIAYITLQYDKKLLVHINVNWLSPAKIRMVLIGGEKRMLVWDDLQSDEKIKIYDKGVKIDNRDGLYKLLVDYRSGDVWSPRISHEEALRVELNYFVDCVRKKQTPVNDGEAGLRVVQMLEMANKSLKSGGKVIKFK